MLGMLVLFFRGQFGGTLVFLGVFIETPKFFYQNGIFRNAKRSLIFSLLPVFIQIIQKKTGQLVRLLEFQRLPVYDDVTSKDTGYVEQE